MTDAPTPPPATGRIVLLGATGYTGTLVAHELVARGARPVLAGRSPDRLDALAADLAEQTPATTAGSAARHRDARRGARRRTPLRARRSRPRSRTSTTRAPGVRWSDRATC